MTGLAISSSIQASSASLVTSTTSEPPSAMWETTAATVLAASVRLCGTLAMTLPPCHNWTWKALGNPCTWTPCMLRIPSDQASDSLVPSRPVMSNP